MGFLEPKPFSFESLYVVPIKKKKRKKKKEKRKKT